MRRIILAIVVLAMALAGRVIGVGEYLAYAETLDSDHRAAFGELVDYADGILVGENPVGTLSLEEDLLQAYVKLQAASLQAGQEAEWIVTAVGAKEPLMFYYRLYRQELDADSNLYWAVEGSALSSASNIYRFAIPSEGRYFLKFEITDADGNSLVFKSEPYETPTDELAAKIEEVLAECISSGMSDYEKALKLHDWLCENAEYDDDLANFQPDGVLLEGKGVCQSFALAYQLLLTEAGVDNIFVVGSAGGLSHGWNLVSMGGDWYHVDVTWDEARSDRYYFGLTTELISRDHIIESRIPAADGIACNYMMNSADGVFCSTEELGALIDGLPGEQCEFVFYHAGQGNIDAEADEWLEKNGAAFRIEEWRCESSGAVTRYICGERKPPEAAELISWYSEARPEDGMPQMQAALETGMKAAAVEVVLSDGSVLERITESDSDNGRRRIWTVSHDFVNDGEVKLFFRALDAEGNVLDETECDFMLEGYSVHSVEFSGGQAAKGQPIAISAATNIGAQRLCMYAEDGRVVKTWNAEKDSVLEGKVRVWKMTYSFSGLGNRTIGFRAEAEDGRLSDEKKLGLEVMQPPAALSAELPHVAYRKESVLMTICTEPQAQYLTMYSESGAKVKTWEQSASVLKDGVRIWTVRYAMSGAGERTLTFRASAEGMFFGSGTKEHILIADTAAGVGYAAFEEKTVGRMGKARIKVRTNADAQRLMMYSENGALAKAWSASASDSVVEGTERIWRVEYAFSGAGKRLLTFRALKEGGEAGAARQAEIEVVSDYALSSVGFVSGTAYAGEKTGIYAESGWTAQYLHLYSEAGVPAGTWPAEGNSTVIGGVRFWNVEYAFRGTGLRKPIFRTSEDGKTAGADRRARILIAGTVPAVSEARFDRNEALRGELVEILIRTNADAARVTMYTEAGAPAKTWKADEANSEINGTERIWRVSYAFSGAGERELTFRAMKEGGAAGEASTAGITVK